MHPLDILFWACFMLGGAYTLFSLLMGTASHAAGHVAHIGDTLHIPHVHDLIGHADAVNGSHAHSASTPHAHVQANGHAHGGHHAGHAHEAELEADHGRFNLMAYLSPMAVAGFLVGFGGMGTGIGILNPGTSAGLRLGISAVCGWGLWLAVYLLVSRVFGNSEGTSHNRREEIVGLRANVTAPIVGSQPGMVAYEIGGTRQSLRAITDDEDPIPSGAVVRIRKIDGHTAHVMRID